MSQNNTSKVIKLATTTPFRSEQDTLVRNIDGTVLNVFNAPVIRALSQGLKMPFEIVMPKDDEFGRKMSDGTWTGIIGMLTKGEADLSVSGLTYNKERTEVVNFSYPMYVSDVTFIISKPEPHPKNFAIFEIFSLEVWIGICLTLLLMPSLLYILLKESESYSTLFMSTIGSLLENAFPFHVRQRNTAILLLFWFLAVTFLTASYKATILSVITFPRMDGIRNTVSDFAKAAKEGSVKCISYKGGIPSVRWFELNDDRLKAIGECMKRSEMEGLHGQGAFLKYPHKKAFVADRLDVITYARDYSISEESFSMAFLGMAYARKFCCPRELESVLHRIAAADLYAKTLRDREFMAQLRRRPQKSTGYDKTRALPLMIKDFMGAFIVLFVGYVLSGLAFLLEVSRTKKPSEKYLVRQPSFLNYPNILTEYGDCNHTRI